MSLMSKYICEILFLVLLLMDVFILVIFINILISIQMKIMEYCLNFSYACCLFHLPYFVGQSWLVNFSLLPKTKKNNFVKDKDMNLAIAFLVAKLLYKYKCPSVCPYVRQPRLGGNVIFSAPN